MTVCVAALAKDSRAIVMVADKALTYGDNVYRPAMTGETGIVKMLPLGDSGWNALVAGSPTFADLVVRRAANVASADPDVANSVTEMMECVKRAYQQEREQAVIDEVLQPRLLTKELFVARDAKMLPLDSTYLIDVANRIAQYNCDCSLLVCGFDGSNEGAIFTVNNPGVAASHALAGYGAIGIGDEIAISRLLWRQAEAEDDVDVALYQVFEAKAHAELIQGVGGSSDAWVMTPGRTAKVEPETIELLEMVFISASSIPFKPRPGWYEPQSPPPDWERKLKRFMRKLMLAKDA